LTEHKNIESPWTKHSYIIRQLDPTILAIFSKTETQETKNLRQKIQDKLDDIKREENRQKQTGQKDESVLEAMQIELQKYYEQLNQLRPLDEKELENRKKIIQYGLVQPKIKSDDDFLDLGIDMSFVWASIVNFSSVPENYAEIMEALFRRKQSDDNKGGADG
jgi:hypothetical protein